MSKYVIVVDEVFVTVVITLYHVLVSFLATCPPYLGHGIGISMCRDRTVFLGVG